MASNNKLYSLRVINYSTPSFISSYRKYYGTEQEIREFLTKAATNKDSSQQDIDILQAAEGYFTGQGLGKASLLGEEPEALIEPVEFLGAAAYEKDNISFKFYNIHRWASDVTIGHIKAELVYLKDRQGIYRRCIRATITNILVEELLGLETLTGDDWMCWGLPGFIVESGEDTLSNTLFYSDTIFKSKHTLLKDQKRPHKPYLRNFFLEIYGDG